MFEDKIYVKNNIASVRKIFDNETIASMKKISIDKITASTTELNKVSIITSRELDKDRIDTISKNPDQNITEIIIKDPEQNITDSISKEPDQNITDTISKEPDKDITVTMCKESENDIIISASNDCKTFQRLLPEPPERPLDSDCCGRGCIPCVMDVYNEEVILWEAECNMLHSGLSRDENTLEQEEQRLHPTQYAHFPIQDIQEETLDSLRIRCSLARNQTLGLSLGQHIIVRSKVPGSSLTRQYTPISPLNAKGYFELLIKIYTEGRMSQRIGTLKVGDKLEARGPAGHLEYVRNKFRRILMLCAGTGIAPICQVISSILADDAEETHLRLVYSCQTYHHLLAKSEIDEWKRFWNFSCLFALTQEPALPSYKYKFGEDIYHGRIDKEILHRELGSSKDNTLILVCGYAVLFKRTWSSRDQYT